MSQTRVALKDIRIGDYFTRPSFLGPDRILRVVGTRDNYILVDIEEAYPQEWGRGDVNATYDIHWAYHPGYPAAVRLPEGI